MHFLTSCGSVRLCDGSCTTSNPESHWIEYIKNANQGENCVVGRPRYILEAVRTNQKNDSHQAGIYLPLLIGDDAEDDEQHL